MSRTPADTLVNADGRVRNSRSRRAAIAFATLAANDSASANRICQVRPELAKKDIAGEGNVTSTKKGLARAKGKAASSETKSE